MIIPEWFSKAVDANIGDMSFQCGGKTYTYDNGVWTAPNQVVSNNQKQTEETFGFKWKREETFDSPVALQRVRSWLHERYGRFKDLVPLLPAQPIILDAGCGASMSALEYFVPFSQIKYIGCDISDAIWIAEKRIRKKVGNEGCNYVLIHDDITQLPFKKGSIDCIFSEGVLHHTDSTRGALASLTPLLRSGGYFLFYVYNKKGPIREFTDDYIREKLQDMSAIEAWEALKPLTMIGQQLGSIDREIDLPNGFPLLGIPAGKISIQRFFYWHILKSFYHPELSVEEMHHINFDWFTPKNAFRQTPEEVSEWCHELGLEIKSMHTEYAGITIIAQKR